MKTRPRLLRLINLRSQWLFTEIGSFFNELELWRKNSAHTFLFFNEHEFRGKTARFMVKFYFFTFTSFSLFKCSTSSSIAATNFVRIGQYLHENEIITLIFNFKLCKKS